MPEAVHFPITARKPRSLVEKAKQADPKALGKSMLGTALSAFSRDWKGTFDGALGTLNTVCANDREETAWLLVTRSIARALRDTLDECKGMLTSDERTHLGADTARFDALEQAEFEVDENLFQAPAKLAIVADYREALQGWIAGLGAPETTARYHLLRFDDHCLYAFRDEWITQKDLYAAIIQETPFDEGIARKLEWERYAAYLERECSKGIFGTEIPLKSLYIPLRAHEMMLEQMAKPGMQREEGEQQPKKPIVFELHEHLQQWISDGKQDDSVRIICGGPGCGKSSFTTMFVAELARKGVRALVVPLQRLTFTDNLLNSVTEYFTTSCEHFNFDPLKSNERVVLFLDGLDELVGSSRAGKDLVHDFLNEVGVQTKNRNTQRLRLQIVITGRRLLFEHLAGLFRKKKPPLCMLPYLIEDQRKYDGATNVIARDDRSKWWINYGHATGKKHGAMPSDLYYNHNLTSITAQPLLNYLTAITYDDDPRVLGTNATENDIYQRVIEGIYRREANKNSFVREILDEQQFFSMLKDVAGTAWRSGDVRKLKLSNLSLPSEELISKLNETDFGLIRLLLVFYFKSVKLDGEETIEFTHKTFAEYLTALAIMRALNALHDDMEYLHSKGRGGSPEICLSEWSRFCRSAVLTHEILDFLRQEIAGKPKNFVANLHKMLCDLFSHVLQYGMPMEKVMGEGGGPGTFNDMNEHAKQAEITLFACINACALALDTKQRSSIRFANPTIFASWLRQRTPIYSQRTHNDVAHECCSRLTIDSQDFSHQDLALINLYDSSITNADLSGVNLREAYLKGADMKGTNMRSADLRVAEMPDVNLTDADLTGANLAHVDLTRADLTRANLTDTDLTGADLTRANLKGACLMGADLTNVHLRDAGNGTASLFIQAASFYQATLPPELKRFIQAKKPELLLPPQTHLKLTHAPLSLTPMQPGCITGAHSENAREESGSWPSR